jgi:hypothetical protein
MLATIELVTITLITGLPEFLESMAIPNDDATRSVSRKRLVASNTKMRKLRALASDASAFVATLVWRRGLNAARIAMAAIVNPSNELAAPVSDEYTLDLVVGGVAESSIASSEVSIHIVKAEVLATNANAGMAHRFLSNHLSISFPHFMICA